MSNQIEVNDLIPGKLKENSRTFVDLEYMSRKDENTLSPIRTRYEAYGLLTENMLAVEGAVGALKTGMKDCMKGLSASDAVFTQSAEATYSSLLDIVMTAATMAVQALNVVYKMEDIIQQNPPPLVAMAESDEDEQAGEWQSDDEEETEEE